MNKIYSVSDTVLVDKTLSRRHLPRGLVEVRKQIVGRDESIIEQIVGEPEGIVINYSDGLVVCEYSLYEIDSVIPETISSEIISVPKTYLVAIPGEGDNPQPTFNLATGTEVWVCDTKTIYLLNGSSFQNIPSAPSLSASRIGPAYGPATIFEAYPSDVTRQKIGGIFHLSVTFRMKAVTS